MHYHRFVKNSYAKLVFTEGAGNIKKEYYKSEFDVGVIKRKTRKRLRDSLHIFLFLNKQFHNIVGEHFHRNRQQDNAEEFTNEIDTSSTEQFTNPVSGTKYNINPYHI